LLLVGVADNNVCQAHLHLVEVRLAYGEYEREEDYRQGDCRNHANQHGSARAYNHGVSSAGSALKPFSQHR
jgi:hypothetical protein